MIYIKYSNERRREFCIQTEIEKNWGGARIVRKRPFFPEAEEHIRKIYEAYGRLKADLEGTGLTVNECSWKDGAVEFPFLYGRTLEEKLDGLLHRPEELTEEIRRYFALFSDGEEEFVETEGFREVFGSVEFARPQKCRKISDIDMIFQNAVETGTGYELIDYEWTFRFPVPVRYLQYRCLYYYILGNSRRDSLIEKDLYRVFDITPEECRQFADMERRFQAYLLGDYTPIWKLYDDISEGVIDVLPLVRHAGSVQRAMRTVEVFFDDGRGFGTWSRKCFRVEAEGKRTLRIEIPDGTQMLRIDPGSGKCVVRIETLSQAGTALTVTANGTQAPNGDYIFDTEDPQLVIRELPHGTAAVECVFFAEPLEGLVRETVLSQDGRLRWMEQTKAWKMYRGCRSLLGRD